MRNCPDMPLERLLTRRYPLSRAPEAFAAAREPGSLKVVLEC
jgi:threonine dehydrogenase-like Zn-dependent dehydrogenase